jgi:hypothetical protein
MPRVNLVNRKTKLGVKALRVAMGGKGHRPSTKNACVGAALRKKKYAKPAEGTGGMRNTAVHQAFYDAAKTCGFNIQKARPK